MGAPGAGSMEEDTTYSSSASVWAASSPWSTTAGGGLSQDDFELGDMPEIGWELEYPVFPDIPDLKKREPALGLLYQDARLDGMDFDDVLIEPGTGL